MVWSFEIFPKLRIYLCKWQYCLAAVESMTPQGKEVRVDGRSAERREAEDEDTLLLRPLTSQSFCEWLMLPLTICSCVFTSCTTVCTPRDWLSLPSKWPCAFVQAHLALKGDERRHTDGFTPCSPKTHLCLIKELNPCALHLCASLCRQVMCCQTWPHHTPSVWQAEVFRNGQC